MHHIFLDESYPLTDFGNQITIAAWIVGQEKFDSYFPSSQDLYHPPILKAIDSMLRTLNGVAIVASGTFSDDVYRIGERDSTDDVTDMARSDNIWSQCAIFAIAMLIRECIRRNVEIGIIDIFHDPKSLKLDHSNALAKTLRGLVVHLAKEYSELRQIPLTANLQIRHICSVAKESHSDQTDKFQLGTWVADKLCSLGFTEPCLHYSRIARYNLSDLVRRTVQQFDGKSFYED